MNKLFTKIVGAALGLTMAIGVGVAVASSNRDTYPAYALDATYTKVTDASTLATGDKIVVATESDSNPATGVTGWNGTKDATVGTTESAWVQYEVTTATGGWYLYDSGADKYIKTPGSSNQFLYGSSSEKAVCSVDSNGVLMCNSRYLCKNSSNYRMYGSIGTYTPFYVWKVAGGSSGGGSSFTDTYSLDGKNIIISASNGSYIPNSIGTSGKPSVTTTKSDSAIFLFEIVGNDEFTLKLTNGTNSGKYLKTGTGTGSSSTINVGASSETWTVVTTSGNKYLRDEDNHYLAANSTTDWRMYANTGNGFPIMSFEVASDDPEITGVAITGGPAASATIGGGAQFTMSATVTAVNDEGESLSRKVNWTVSPAGAVTFSKSQSDSGEEITVTAVNTANNGVVITAASAATGFASIKATSNSFDIIKAYDVSSVTLSATTVGGPTYDASGASSFNVSFTTAVIYNGDAGTSKVNITVSPDAGVTGHGNNVAAGAFTLTFTKPGTYTVTSTSVEKNTKYASVSVTINNIVIPGYELVNNTGSIRNGSKAIIHSAGETHNMIMTSQSDNGYRNTSNYTVTDNFIPTSDLPSGSEVLTLVVSGSHWELKTNDNKYLSLTENGNKLYTSNSADTTNNTTEWDISFNGNNAVITSVAYSNRVIRCNGGSTRFACYEGTQQAIQLYVLVDTSPYFTVNTASVYLGNRGTQSLQLTAHNGASDTVTWASNNTGIATVSPASGLSTTVTACESGTGTATITATFASGEYDPIEVIVEVMELDTYVNIGVTTFTKVSSNNGDWSGTYLLVDETASKIFDGSASPLGASSEKEVTISSDQISATGLLASSFNIKTSTNGYTLKSNSNYYVGNRSATKGLMTSLGVQYEVSIDSDGTITALLEDGTSSSTTLRHNNTDGIFRFYDNTSGNALSLYKANGEMRAITSTLTSWYDDAKANGYLTCHASGSGSSIDFDSLADSAADILEAEDFDTLKKMSAKSAEDNGNYLEDFISDYDYLVMYKGQTDFLDRFAEGGAMHGASRFVSSPVSSMESETIYSIIVIVSLVGLTTIGGYFFLRKRKEQ